MRRISDLECSIVPTRSQEVAAFLGKDSEGRPGVGHGHAFFLPADEDGDGRLDHVTVWAPMGLSMVEIDALQRLRRVPWGAGDDLAMVLIGQGMPGDFRAAILGEAAVWRSATPFVANRYPKVRGRKRDRAEDLVSGEAFARSVLLRELGLLRERRPELPAVEGIDILRGCGGDERWRSAQFRKDRGKRGDDGGRRSSGAFRVRFAGPTAGPICLGHSSHFGLGLFVRE